MAIDHSPVDLVRGFQGLRALVVGDAMLDAYVEGVATRLCKEGPVPVIEKATETLAPGGAANAAANLRALGAEVVFVGIVGRDKTAGDLRETLRAHDVDSSWLVEDESCRTIRKTRILANDQYVIRFDEGETRACGGEGLRQVVRHIEENFARCDLVVVPDYGYGAASNEVIATIRQLRTVRPVPLAVDAKDPLRFAQASTTIITPNFNEAWAAVHPATSSPRNPSMTVAAEVGRTLLGRIDADHVAITLASDGVLLFDRSGQIHHLPTYPVPHAGDVGAGDSFTAALTLALAAGATVQQAAQIGIDAAGIAIAKRRTAVVEHRELLRRVSLDDGTPVHSLKTLAAIVDGERYAGKRIVFTNGVFDILHAGHVQILRRAKALGDVLIVGINSDASTRRLKGDARPVNHERDRLALVSALESVDHAVIFDEDNPAELIRALRPHIHVKGGDYTPEALPEAGAAHDVGARIEILSLVDGRSTTNVINKILTLAANGTIEASA